MALDQPFTFTALHVAPTLAWLAPGHRGAILAHLRRLDMPDRINRFGRMLSDDELAAFVDELDFDAHWLIGAFSYDQRLVACAHACPVRSGRDCTVYAAISVDAQYRGKGLGRALLGSIVDRLHQAAATTVVAIGSCFELPGQGLRGEPGADRGAYAYEVCTGIRIEAERLPPGRAYRDTLAQLRA